MAARRMFLHLVLALALALAAALAIAPRAQGAVCVWTGAVTNDWFTPGNWNCGSVAAIASTTPITQRLTICAFIFLPTDRPGGQ